MEYKMKKHQVKNLPSTMAKAMLQVAHNSTTIKVTPCILEALYILTKGKTEREGKICVEGMVMNLAFYACQLLEMPLDFKEIANLPSFVLLHMGYFSDKFTLFEYNICSNLCCWIWICIQGRGLKTKAVQGHMVFHPKLVQGSS